MLFARNRYFTKTIRFRLAVWNASVVILASMGTLFVLRESLRFALMSELDQVLVEDIRELALSLDAGSRADDPQVLEALNRKAQAHELHGWFVRLSDFDGSGGKWSSNGAPELSGQMRLSRNRLPISVGSYRVVQDRYERGSLTVLVGSSLTPIQQDMSLIDRNAMLICLGLVMVAPLCGYWLAGRATHPFAAMIHTTALLRPAQLSERLPVRGTSDELDQLAQQVNKLLDRIAQYLETKRDFLANAAHELRSPLAAIRSTVEVALNEDRKPEEYQSVLEGLLDETANLANLVSQLLLLAETEADCLTVAAEFVELNELVSQSIEMFAPVAEDRGIQLRAHQSDSLVVEGSRLHLRQVIINLVENAIKFTPQGGTITVSTARQEEHSRAELRVTDTGSGISADDLPHIFERFFRSDRSRPRQGESRGTGLGLSICESVVQMHGGTITATSQPGKGTEMTVMLPLATTDVPERSILYGKALRQPLRSAARVE